MHPSSHDRRFTHFAGTLTAALFPLILLSCTAPGEQAPRPGDSAGRGSLDSAGVRARQATGAIADTAWLVGARPDADAVRAVDSEATLIARYGALNVKRDEVHEGDGSFVPGTVLFPEDSARRLEIQWADTVAYRQPRLVTATGRAWVLHPGIRFGTSLRELEQMNGGPFDLTGFRGHNPGTVTGWRGGLLEHAFAGGAAGGSRLTLQLQPEPPYPVGASTESYSSENVYQSSDAGIQRLNPRVVVIAIEPR